jgi:ribosomal protein S12 methylthiotransferase accessory factor
MIRVAGITRLANITGLDRIGIPVVTAVRPAAQTLSVAAGKGVTLDDARTSAAMEAIEFYSAETVTPSGDGNPLLRVSNDVPLRRYAIADNRADRGCVTGADLISGEPCTLPIDLVSLADSADPRNPYRPTSNGLASGAVLVEALLAAVLELVERDAVACWRFLNTACGLPFPRVQLESIMSWPRAGALVKQLLDAGIQLLVYDCKADTLVPVYLVRLFDVTRRHTGIFSGSGAHVDPEVALVRALTEAAQSRAVYIAGSRDDLSCLEFEQLRAQDGQRLVERLLYQPATVIAGAVHSPSSETFEQHIAWILGRLLAIGIERVIMVDLTPEPFRGVLSVVRVVAPGLAGTGIARSVVQARAESLLQWGPA